MADCKKLKPCRLETILNYLSRGGKIKLLKPAITDTNVQYTQPARKPKTRKHFALAEQSL